MRLRLLGVLGLAIGLALIVAVVVVRSNGSRETGRAAQDTTATEPRGEAAEAEGEPRGGTEEVQEEQQETAERLEALAKAKAAGRFGRKVAATTDPAPGWVGSQIMNSATDDWEPASRPIRPRRTSTF